MSRNWRWETTGDRAIPVILSFALGFLLGWAITHSTPAHGASAKPLTVMVCASQAASFRYEGGVMYVTCPPDTAPALTVYGCNGPSLERNTKPGPRGYEYTFHCQSWTSYIQTPVK